jgi:hypothetical protein
VQLGAIPELGQFNKKEKEESKQEQIKQRRNTQHALRKKQNYGNVPKKKSENKLKTNSFCNYSATTNPGRRTTFNTGQKHKNNIEFCIQ